MGAQGTIPIFRPAPAASPLWSATAMAESRRRRTQARRREVFMGLVISMGATLVLGFIPSMQVFWALHVVLDVLFAGYVALLVHLRNLANERSAKVRFLPARPQVEPALLLRRSVN
jgi:Flp pilus assembly protein TadB